jgi:hypothetical protein
VQARCPTGTSDTGLACVSVPSVPTCAAGQQYVLGRCFGSCPANYRTVGLTCVQNTPPGWNDGGISFYRWVNKRVCVWRFCRNTNVLETQAKQVTGRPGTGLARNCPAGQSMVLGFCQRTEIKSTYVRSGVTNRFQGSTDSFVRNVEPIDAKTNDDQTFTVASSKLAVSQTRKPCEFFARQIARQRITPALVDPVKTGNRTTVTEAEGGLGVCLAWGNHADVEG